jgi:hypothetical protein
MKNLELARPFFYPRRMTIIFIRQRESSSERSGWIYIYIYIYIYIRIFESRAWHDLSSIGWNNLPPCYATVEPTGARGIITDTRSYIN